MGSTSKYGRATINPSAPRALGICDRCGFLYNLDQLHNQWDWAGSGMTNRHIRVCRGAGTRGCYDIPNEQLRSIILPPDPRPARDPRPEPYEVDERSEYEIRPPIGHRFMFAGRADVQALLFKHPQFITADISASAVVFADVQHKSNLPMVVTITSVAAVSGVLQPAWRMQPSISGAATVIAGLKVNSAIVAAISSTSAVNAILRDDAILSGVSISTTAAVSATLSKDAHMVGVSISATAAMVVLTSVPVVTLITATGAGSWSVPAGVSTVVAECWGAGGNGSQANGNISGAGGGGGSYAVSTNVAVTPSGTAFYNIAVGGAGLSATPSLSTWFNGATNAAPTVNTGGARAISGGNASSSSGGGASTSGGVGNTLSVGGVGGNGANTGGTGGGAGGGGSAGPIGVGKAGGATSPGGTGNGGGGGGGSNGGSSTAGAATVASVATGANGGANTAGSAGGVGGAGAGPAGTNGAGGAGGAAATTGFAGGAGGAQTNLTAGGGGGGAGGSTAANPAGAAGAGATPGGAGGGGGCGGSLGPAGNGARGQLRITYQVTS